MYKSRFLCMFTLINTCMYAWNSIYWIDHEYLAIHQFIVHVYENLSIIAVPISGIWVLDDVVGCHNGRWMTETPLMDIMKMSWYFWISFGYSLEIGVDIEFLITGSDIQLRCWKPKDWSAVIYLSNKKSIIQLNLTGHLPRGAITPKICLKP